ncbi:efflux RND transporter periplasmic adaptor subunit [Rhizobacter sp. Root1221]|uniref:efflux RND transporter periplasmic adaptor subunit n=1 Tax=Rhizobacter sp. Root1221 TaxID=1736433 RepID=UPI0006F67A4C|nr:efflux RND transporter periplasmic adaptor subunit [Rhizobacter sp. Root1221]KQW02898.1 RND transporter [Rhizobacter sp. Root1221]
MKTLHKNLVLGALLLVIGLGLGIGLSRWRAGSASSAAPISPSTAPAGERQVLYWYDPMVPQQKFDKPGKSPFMDMQLVPKYAGEAPAGGVAVDPRVAQTLGWRTAAVEKITTGAAVEVAATVQLNEREVAVVQARSSGFVERVASLAPGDVVSAGASIAELLVPEWSGALQEFLAVRGTGDAALTAAARQRLVLLGIPASTIDRVERTGQVQARASVHAPISGLLQELMVRPGMTVSPGMTLAKITGLSSVWLEASLPETQTAFARLGMPAEARMAAFPGELLKGKVTTILPEANAQTRTLRVRIELPNPQGRLRAGMFAQVRLAGVQSEALVVPAEAVVRTGLRALVYLVDGPGRYRPVEVQVGRELGDKLEVLNGLQAGQQVVASGQFLLDSEASMQGVMQRQASTATAAAAVPTSPSSSIHQGTGKILELTAQEVTLDHGPIPSMQWGAMQMPFKLPSPEAAKGLKVGDAVRFSFSQTNDGFVIQTLERNGATK